MSTARHSASLLACLALFALSAPVFAQHTVTPADGKIVTSASAAQAPDQAPEDPDIKSERPGVDSAWDMLTAACHKSTQAHIVALAALGTMGSNPRAARLIAEGTRDSELDVRIAAILAAGQTGNRALLPALRERLRDHQPHAVFIAALTLWKLHDHAGEAVLKEIAFGERKAKPGLMRGAKNDVNHELHDPTALAELSATEGASILLGPFGFGIKAIEYMRKSGGQPARATAIGLLAESHVPGMRGQLLECLSDKDTAVRAAAARALGQLREPSSLRPLGVLFSDARLPVRLSAASAYINCSHRTARDRS